MPIAIPDGVGDHPHLAGEHRTINTMRRQRNPCPLHRFSDRSSPRNNLISQPIRPRTCRNTCDRTKIIAERVEPINHPGIVRNRIRTRIKGRKPHLCARLESIRHLYTLVGKDRNRCTHDIAEPAPRARHRPSDPGAEHPAMPIRIEHPRHRPGCIGFAHPGKNQINPRRHACALPKPRKLIGIPEPASNSLELFGRSNRDQPRSAIFGIIVRWVLCRFGHDQW